MDYERHDRSMGARTNGSTWRIALAFVAFAGIAAFFLLAEHRAHMLGILPWALLLLACPLLHMFMHGGHGGHDHLDHGRSRPGTDTANDPPAGSGSHRH
ncbi:hypothetical protein B2G71_11635 [Novosphingobium sp. PC22D]|uniref:DUF2933 domain-containing protein n=2 Tax=Sphingomonadaceae TaxID=41297 RepID=A0ABQ2JJ18_9SPHN|nr:DUF2933 domain-containing protein [Novosphingobium sp. PC22D]PEQ12510.1 hypothetical protein B2G71_11635 [Novosphingobium sp. PC22D]GGN46157.1 hypothetical protein GCM10011349_12960 [Novosphingobium indicum]